MLQLTTVWILNFHICQLNGTAHVFWPKSGFLDSYAPFPPVYYLIHEMNTAIAVYGGAQWLRVSSY
jgi:hypothetical protein